VQIPNCAAQFGYGLVRLRFGSGFVLGLVLPEICKLCTCNFEIAQRILQLPQIDKSRTLQYY